MGEDAADQRGRAAGRKSAAPLQLDQSPESEQVDPFDPHGVHSRSLGDVGQRLVQPESDPLSGRGQHRFDPAQQTGRAGMEVVLAAIATDQPLAGA